MKIHFLSWSTCINLDIVGKYFIIIAYNYIANFKKSLLLQHRMAKAVSKPVLIIGFV